MTPLEFMSDSPFLTFFLLWMVLECIECLWTKFWRGINIARHGWPPAHCDADGDLRQDPKQDDDREAA